jgi:predicted AlkP superfamily pyrophosphatase or phosphodiesterase
MRTLHGMFLRGILLGLFLLTTAWGADPILILVSIDAFRWDYLEKYSAATPHLRALAADGVRAERLISCYPSSTFPNHYSIATGLRPAHHGIVDNRFFDPVLGAAFDYRSHECVIDSRWWGGEPIWITAVKQGRRSACMFWPGSEAEIAGVRPTFSKTFDGRLTCAQRVDGLLAWLDLPAAQRPDFCTLYFDVVDHAGHDFGPDAPETAEAVRDVDAAIDRLLTGLAARGLRDTANLVIVSDHGMTATVPDGFVYLDDFVDLEALRVDFAGTQAGLRPRTGTAAELVAKIREARPAHVRVDLREDLPEHLHYSGNPRIPPVLLLADEGWGVATRQYVANRRKTERGEHGYDPALQSMGATFIASGPAFRHGIVLPPFENIQIYNLLCAVLGLRPAPNDGNDLLVQSALCSPPVRKEH